MAVTRVLICRQSVTALLMHCLQNLSASEALTIVIQKEYGGCSGAVDSAKVGQNVVARGV